MAHPWCIKTHFTAAPSMVISTALNTAQAVYAGNSVQGEQLQARHWSRMILCTLVPQIIKFTHYLPEKEFLWINFSAGYLVIKNKSQRLPRILPTRRRYRNSRYKPLSPIRTRALIFSSLYPVADSRWASSVN